ncbi:hypothetical protein RDV89_09095 [Nocardioides zeae]|uniref:Uncharacterized protein n=1 Tax=Nocardioides imazamoxiresistens TaxID=3231893 RepID=A0ABU3PVF5_9ACTN|nr:hypothetical protein [Nocardioides zeae]MDT9593223.1 hypothetical protein [Nocardioides zeae]
MDRRAAVVGALCGLAGTALVVQTFLPWASSGSLSRTPPVEVVALALDGTLSVVGAGDVVVLLAVPVLGALLLATAAVRLRPVRLLRALAGAVAVALVAVLLVRLAGLDPTRLDAARPGLGAAVGGLAALLVLVGVALDASPGRTARTARTVQES